MLPNEQLVQLAQDARQRAYAPYSGYLVGAAIESDTGEVSIGCNVENLSYGATICAERTAVTSMIAEDKGKRIRQIAIASLDGVTPCGMCLQVLSEFAEPHTLVHCSRTTGEVTTFSFRDLLPHAFVSSEVGRTDSDAGTV
jgi:cytidine deaminase